MITAIQSAPTAAISQRISVLSMRRRRPGLQSDRARAAMSQRPCDLSLLPFCSPRSAPPNLLGGSTGCTLGTAIAVQTIAEGCGDGDTVQEDRPGRPG